MISAKRIVYGVVAVLLLLAVALPLSGQEADTTDQRGRPRFGGPDAVTNLLESDRADKDVLFEIEFLKPYHEWQAGLREKYGLSLGIDYTAVYLTATHTLPATDDHAASGMVEATVGGQKFEYEAYE